MPFELRLGKVNRPFAILLALSALGFLALRLGDGLARVEPSIALFKQVFVRDPDDQLLFPLGRCNAMVPLAVTVSQDGTGKNDVDWRSERVSPYLIGIAYMRAQNPALSDKYLADAAARTQIVTLALHARGVLAWKQGRQADAYAFWRQAGTAHYFVAVGTSCLTRGYVDAADRYFSLALNSMPADDLAGYQVLVKYFSERGDRTATERSLAAYLALDPSISKDHYLLLSRAYLLLNRFSDAQQSIAQLVELALDDAEAWYVAGMLAYDQKDFTLARDTWQHALALAPGRLDTYIYMGNSYLLQQEMDEAYNWYARGLTVAPENSWSLVNMANVRLAQRRFRETLDLAVRATAVDKGAHIPSLAAQAAVGLQDWATARSWIEQAIRIGPNDVNYHILRAQICQSSGDSACARAAYRQVLELDPNNTEARDALHQLEGGKP